MTLLCMNFFEVMRLKFTNWNSQPAMKYINHINHDVIDQFDRNRNE